MNLSAEGGRRQSVQVEEVACRKGLPAEADTGDIVRNILQQDPIALDRGRRQRSKYPVLAGRFKAIDRIASVRAQTFRIIEGNCDLIRSGSQSLRDRRSFTGNP